MFTHNLDPLLFDFGFLAIRWYSLAYIFGIVFSWWYGKKIIANRFNTTSLNFKTDEFDDLVTYLIISILVGGRLGYVLFYNLEFFVNNPINIFMIWEGGMSFHGALIGIVFGTYVFSKKKNIKTFFLLDIIACTAPVGIFLGRVANFINGELVGKVTDVKWSVIFPNTDMMPRHPSQMYEALLEGIVLFFILNTQIFKRNYKIGSCSYLFLIFYGIFRIFSELFREPDPQLGYIFGMLSMGTILSFFMIFFGIIILILTIRKNEI